MSTHSRVRWPLTVLAAIAFVVAIAQPWAATLTEAVGPVVINEVESNLGVPGDWVELFNSGNVPADIGGFKFRDSGNAPYTIPLGTMIPPSGYFVLNEIAQFSFGLGAGDSARLFDSDDILVDSFAWTAHARTTYGRCPNGTGVFITTASSTKGAENNCKTVSINEFESDGGTPADWVELLNYGATSLDISGYIVKDNNNAPSFVIPDGTTLAAGAFLVIEQATLGFSLDAPDSVRLFTDDGITLVDSFSWMSHSATSYGRCTPDGTGVMVLTAVATKGAANICELWPGGPDVQTVDPAATFTSNLSGLTYESSGTAAPGVLWAVRNGPERLYRLIRDGAMWVPDAGDWLNGKDLRYENGLGLPDSEGVTFAASSDTGMYVATERDNANNTISRLSVLRFDPTDAGTTLVAHNDWDLTADLPPLPPGPGGANTGLEAITWIPDAFLTGQAFFDESTGKKYKPSDYPNHAGGLFLVGVEATGIVYAFALNHADDTFTRIATIPSGFPAVMALEFDREQQLLWANCDDTCGGLSAVLQINKQGRFAVTRVFERPAGMPNLNSEGFAVASQAECTDGRKPAFWTDDGDTPSGPAGRSLRMGTVDCGPTSVEECKEDGWKDFDFPAIFKNQGDCVSHVQQE